MMNAESVYQLFSGLPEIEKSKFASLYGSERTANSNSIPQWHQEQLNELLETLQNGDMLFVPLEKVMDRLNGNPSK
jgi:hypothetical protein